MSDITEVKSLLDNLKYIEGVLPSAINNWRNEIKTCDWAVTYQSQGVLKSLCERPGTLSRDIFTPLYSFLNGYIANREGRQAFSGKGLDVFLGRGLRAIKNFAIVADFFAKNPQYIVPNQSVSNFEAYKAAGVKQCQYKDLIMTITERLIGCKQGLNFKFLPLINTVKTFTPELQDVRQFLQSQCDSMRIERLRMPNKC